MYVQFNWQFVYLNFVINIFIRRQLEAVLKFVFLLRARNVGVAWYLLGDG